MKHKNLSNKLTAVEKLAILMAAAIHDYDHPGYSNNFLVKTRDPLAILYNDFSPLENHHLAASFEILYSEECNIFSHLSREDQDVIRRIMIDLVLATDNAKHFTLLSSFNAKVNVGNLDIEKGEDLTLMLQILIKCADVSNPGKNLPIYQQWVDRIVEEFFQQGDKERALGLPISPFMDRENPKTPKSQINFIEYICAPVYLTVGEQLNRMDIHQISQTNLAYWKQQHDLQNPTPSPSSTSTSAPSNTTTTTSASSPSNTTTNTASTTSSATSQQSNDLRMRLSSKENLTSASK